MTRRGPRDWLQDIRIAAEDAQDFLAGMDEAMFLALPTTNRRTYRALKMSWPKSAKR